MKKKYNKSELFIFMISLLVLAAGFLLCENDLAYLFGIAMLLPLGLMYLNTPKLSGLSPDNPKVRTMQRMNVCSMILVVILCLLCAFHKTDFPKHADYEFWVILALILLTGNIAPKLPFNRHTGLRLPWTIRDEDTWRTAHKVLGLMTFPAAFLMALCYFLFGKQDAVIIACFAGWLGIPGIYSLIYFYRTRT